MAAKDTKTPSEKCYRTLDGDMVHVGTCGTCQLADPPSSAAPDLEKLRADYVEWLCNPDWEQTGETHSTWIQRIIAAAAHGQAQAERDYTEALTACELRLQSAEAEVTRLSLEVQRQSSLLAQREAAQKPTE